MSLFPPTPPLTPTRRLSRRFQPPNTSHRSAPRYASNQEVWLKATNERPNMRVIITESIKDIYGDWRYQIQDKDGVSVDDGRWFDEKVLV
jgi:hypothetical protein